MITTDRWRKVQKDRCFIAYLIGVHLLVAVMLLKTDFVPKLAAKLLPGSMLPNPHGERMVGYHQAMDASVPAGAAIFLGDSITQALAVAAVSKVPVNYGISGATTSELLGNIPKYKSIERASAVFLMIGINDLGQGKLQGLADRLRSIESALPKNVPLVWSGIMPAYSGDVDPAQISAANKVIQDICAARAGCTYVNMQVVFASEGAALFRDGMHPNDEGYARWIDALKRASRSLQLDPAQPSHGQCSASPEPLGP